MSIVKKWATCVISFIAGVLSMALSACSGMVVNATMAGQSVYSETTKAFEILTDAELLTTAEKLKIDSQFITLKVFLIIMLVIAIALLVYSIVMLLKNINVIKSENKIFDIVTYVLVALFLVSTIAVVVSSSVYGTALVDSLTTLQFGGMATVTATVGVYQWLMLAVSIITALVATTCAILNRKSK